MFTFFLIYGFICKCWCKNVTSTVCSLDIKAKMSPIVSVHVYSVQKALLKDSGPLYSVDYDAVKDNLKDCHRYLDIVVVSCAQVDWYFSAGCVVVLVCLIITIVLFPLFVDTVPSVVPVRCPCLLWSCSRRGKSSGLLRRSLKSKNP